MRFDLTPTDFSILQRALTQCPCTTKQERQDIEAVKRNLLKQAGQNIGNHRPRVGTSYTPIRSAWPSGDVIRERKSNGFFDSSVARSSKVGLNNSKAPKQQLTVADVLQGLL